jgi:predicted transcriptional regulator
MAKTKASELEKAAPSVEKEDRATLEAIDEGLRDASAGRTVSAEQVRRLLPKWISASSSRKER